MTESNACPKCGYCPHCGRTNAAPMRIWWNPPYPQPADPIYWVGGRPYGTADDGVLQFTITAAG